MKFLKLFKNSQVFKLALGVAILVVCYFGTKFFSQMQKLTSTLELIAKSNETQLELEKLLSIINSYDYSLRNYIITKDETYLQNRFLNRGIIEEGIKKLKVLTANDSVRNKDILTLEKLINYRFNLFRETLIAAKSSNVDQLGLNTLLKKSNDYTEMMKLFVYKIINSERLKTKFQNSNHQFELQDSLITAFLLIILSLLILMLSFNKTNIDIEELKQANDKLKLLNESFNTAEKTAGFGHWMVNLETDEYTFSDNLYRLMGVEPNAFEPNLENITKYFHPEDQEYVAKVHNDSMVNHQSTSIVFRYLTATNEVKYIMGASSFTKDGNGDLIKIGVSYDITDQYKNTLELEENNKELKYVNTELESFNNIVSHDLQEPLRKIQMFISRLEEKEFKLLSQQGRDYFSKVSIAANRMQTLLIDLVDYSRTIKGDKVFVETDLNEILEEILLDLSINVEEKNALIQIRKLPKIKAIPFQIKQLFINVLTNSLKYSLETRVPKISITCEVISAEEVHQHKINNEEDYYKIVVEDNGIGFKQEYAEKIFLLFKRLETDPKYSGTGLGLAICNRIVENHNGFIWAKSQPNEGAKFSILLPKANKV